MVSIDYGDLVPPVASYQSRNLLGAGLIPPQAVGDLAVLLASDRFRFTTGTFLRSMVVYPRRSPLARTVE